MWRGQLWRWRAFKAPLRRPQALNAFVRSRSNKWNESSLPLATMYMTTPPPPSGAGAAFVRLSADTNNSTTACKVIKGVDDKITIIVFMPRPLALGLAPSYLGVFTGRWPSRRASSESLDGVRHLLEVATKVASMGGFVRRVCGKGGGSNIPCGAKYALTAFRL